MNVMWIPVIMGISLLVAFIMMAIETSTTFNFGPLIIICLIIFILFSLLLLLYTLSAPVHDTIYTTENTEETTHALAQVTSENGAYYLIQSGDSFQYYQLDEFGGTSQKSADISQSKITYQQNTANMKEITTQKTYHDHWWFFDSFDEEEITTVYEFSIPSRDNILFTFEE